MSEEIKEEIKEETQEVKSEAKKNNTVFAAVMCFLAIGIMVFSVLYIYKDNIFLGLIKQSAVKNLENIYELDELCDVTIYKIEPGDARFYLAWHDSLEYDENSVYYRMYFSVKEGQMKYCAILDKKGQVLSDSYANSKFQQEMTEYVEAILDNAECMKGVEYRLYFTPYDIRVTTGHSDTFDEFREYYDADMTITRGVFEMIIVGDADKEMLTDICTAFLEGGSPFSVKISTVTESLFSEIKDVVITDDDSYTDMYDKLDMRNWKDAWHYSGDSSRY